MRPVHRLQVHLRVPVGVIDDDHVGRGQVDAQPAGTRRQHEDELGAVLRVVVGDHVRAVLVRRLAIEPAVLVAAPVAKVLQDVQHARHLAEDEYARVLLLQLPEQLVEHHHLAGVLQQVVVGRVRRARLGPVEQVRVVGALAQLHEDVLQAHLLHLARPVHHVDVLHQDLGVPVALHLRQADEDLHLLLRQQPLLDLGLEPPQQERLQHGVQPLDQRVVVHALVRVEPAVEVIGAVEDVRQQEVEQRPELVQVVLQRRTGQQQPVGGLELAQDLRQLRLFVLDAVRLVDHHVAPVEPLERRLLADAHLVRRDAHVPLARRQHVPNERVARLLVADQAHGSDRRTPACELVHPVLQRRLRHDHDVRSRVVAQVFQVAEQRDRLQCLTEAHLVRQDPVDAVLVQRNHPVQPADLVVAHLARLDVRRRRLEPEHLLRLVVRLGQQLLVLLLLRLPVPVVARIGIFVHLRLAATRCLRRAALVRCRVHEVGENFRLLQQEIEPPATVRLQCGIVIRFLCVGRGSIGV
uniref:Uncharacterized protein n=1 Tax=Anopheles atroparvus TaxID=41427 RepID=A0AAG5DLD8_ANOAO